MRLTDGIHEFEAVPVSPNTLLLHGGHHRPEFVSIDMLFEGHRFLTERRRLDRRRPPHLHTWRRTADRRCRDQVTFGALLESAALTKRLQDRRRTSGPIAGMVE